MSKPTLLFDLDGTLVDTDPLHFQAFCAMLAECGAPAIDLAYYRKNVMGGGLRDIFSRLMPERAHAEHQALANRKEALFREMVTSLEPTLGLLELLEWAKAEGVRCALVTNAPRENANLVLEVLGIRRYFEALVIAEELEHTKPHPLPYLTGLRALEATADAAFAFEDSFSGVRAAAAAGIRTVGVRSSLPDEALRDAGAAYVITDFRDPQLWSELRAS